MKSHADQSRRTSLHEAVIENDVNAVAAELKSGDCDVNAADYVGNTPLHYAAQDGHADIADMLLASGAEVDSQNNDGNSPLWLATYYFSADSDLIAKLLESGANPHSKNKLGLTPERLAFMMAQRDRRRFYELPHKPGTDMTDCIAHN